jgi:hypothetical protein
LKFGFFPVLNHTGSSDTLSGIQPDYSKLDKLFAIHLYTDPIGDLATLWIAGWIGGRYTPLQVGPLRSYTGVGYTIYATNRINKTFNSSLLIWRLL